MNIKKEINNFDNKLIEDIEKGKKTRKPREPKEPKKPRKTKNPLNIPMIILLKIPKEYF